MDWWCLHKLLFEKDYETIAEPNEKESCDLLAASVMCAGLGAVVHTSPTCFICSSYADPLPRSTEMCDQLGETTGSQGGRSNYLALPVCALDLHLSDLAESISRGMPAHTCIPSRDRKITSSRTAWAT